MAWLRRSCRTIFDDLRCSNSNMSALRNTNTKLIASYTTLLRSSFRNSRISEFSQPFFRNSSLQNWLSQSQCRSPFLSGAKRFYYVDRNQVYHFKPKGYKKLVQSPRNLIILVLVSSGVVITIYFGNLETVPYSKRTHFVLLSRSLEKELGENQFKQFKNEHKGRILPPIHPYSIRVQNISQNIIEALQRGIGKEKVWSDIRYSTDSQELSQKPHSNETVMESGDKIVEKEILGSEDKWLKEDEFLDDRWVQQSRKKHQENGKNSDTGHLEGLEWEVIVVSDPAINAFCAPGGKIVVFSGLLNHFTTDNEIATVIGHEVGHAVARHSAEQISKNIWLTLMQLILYQFFMPDIINTMSNLFLRLPFSRRMEMEADYIGLMLIASAGYDPRLAPEVYERLGKVGGDSELQDYLATHPSGKKRAQLLLQAEVMEEAVNIYREAQLGQAVEGFL